MWRQRWQVMMERICVAGDEDDERRLLQELADKDHCAVLAFVNAHAMNSMVHDLNFFSALAGADILLRDGSGMAMLYRRLRRRPGLNMNGTDFIPKILEAFRGRKVAFWGTDEPYLGIAAARAEAEFGVLMVSRHHGFENPDFYPELARRDTPELVILGMGMPKQEIVAQLIRDRGGVPALVVCGGAIIDFLGGKVQRAPAWMRLLGIEWVYRLLREPGRLFRRYVIGNPLFMIRVWRWQQNG